MCSADRLPVSKSFAMFSVWLLATSIAWAGDSLGDMADVGGYRLQCRVMGSGAPAVVFLNGGSAKMEYWDDVATDIARTTTVVTYERAGHQKSEMGREPRHGKNVVHELKALLEALAIPGPYVFVAHSAGCMYARIFGDVFPEDVFGMILLDPGDRDLLDEFGERYLQGSDRSRWAEYWDATWNRLAQRTDGFGKEIQHKDATIAQMKRSEFPADLALYVISGADTSRPPYYLADYGAQAREDFYAFVQDYHKALVKDMPAGKHISVDDAGHVIHQDRPDLVISLIRSLLE